LSGENIEIVGGSVPEGGAPTPLSRAWLYGFAIPKLISPATKTADRTVQTYLRAEVFFVTVFNQLFPA
jgi:hypothetical protein